MTKEEAIKVLKSNYPSSCYTMLREAVDIAIEALSKPSLPSNLDEAAEISDLEAKNLADDYTDFLATGLIKNEPRPISPKWMKKLASDRFKAGAEWMAGQGETCEFEVYLDSLKCPDGTLYEYPACYMRLPGGVAGTYCVPEKEYKEGDEVVVQIRKK